MTPEEFAKYFRLAMMADPDYFKEKYGKLAGLTPADEGMPAQGITPPPGENYVAGLKAAGMPIGDEGGITGEGPAPSLETNSAAAAGGAAPGLGLSKDAMVSLLALLPKEPVQRYAPFIGAGPGPSQVRMSPIVDERFMKPDELMTSTLGQLISGQPYRRTYG